MKSIYSKINQKRKRKNLGNKVVKNKKIRSLPQAGEKDNELEILSLKNFITKNPEAAPVRVRNK